MKMRRMEKILLEWQASASLLRNVETIPPILSETGKLNTIKQVFFPRLPAGASSPVELLTQTQCIIAYSFVLRGCSPESKSWLLILIKGSSIHARSL